MWSYYGAKTNVVKAYPKPLHHRINEVFAGSARYSLEHFECDVLLVDKYPVVIDIWQYLQSCSPKDILSLPDVKLGETLNDYTWDCGAAKSLMGFMIQYGVASPGLKPSPSKMNNRPNFINFTKKRIAENLFKIKHWKFECKSYLDIPDQEATWFVDPPYQFGGHKYVHGNNKINFEQLANWCHSRSGQLIVCENQMATWLPFVPLKLQHGSNGFNEEVIYTNYHTHFNNVQQKLF